MGMSMTIKNYFSKKKKKKKSVLELIRVLSSKIFY